MTQQQTPRPTPNLPDPFRKPECHPQHRTPVASLVVITAAILGVLLYWAWPYLNPTPVEPTTHTVVYEVAADTATGAGRTGSVTMQTSSGTVQSTATLPATFNPGILHSGDFVYVSVQNGQGAGSVTCRITVDGVAVSENTSSGGYTIASCQGTVPR